MNVDLSSYFIFSQMSDIQLIYINTNRLCADILVNYVLQYLLSSCHFVVYFIPLTVIVDSI